MKNREILSYGYRWITTGSAATPCAVCTMSIYAPDATCCVRRRYSPRSYCLAPSAKRVCCVYSPSATVLPRMSFRIQRVLTGSSVSGSRRRSIAIARSLEAGFGFGSARRTTSMADGFAASTCEPTVRRITRVEQRESPAKLFETASPASGIATTPQESST